MTELEHFHTALPFEIVTDRLKNARINGVVITVKSIGSDEATFRLDLRKRSAIGLTLTVAHLKGTMRQGNDSKTYITYHAHPLARHSIVMIPSVGIALTILLILVLSPELTPIASIPGIAGVLFGLFWTMLSSDFRKNDQFRLKELIERMLEKQSSMTAWQA